MHSMIRLSLSTRDLASSAAKSSLARNDPRRLELLKHRLEPFREGVDRRIPTDRPRFVHRRNVRPRSGRRKVEEIPGGVLERVRVELLLFDEASKVGFVTGSPFGRRMHEGDVLALPLAVSERGDRAFVKVDSKVAGKGLDRASATGLGNGFAESIPTLQSSAKGLPK